MIGALLSGVSLGFGAGVSPGPLTTLVITTTLERGFWPGLRVSMAPFLSDLPIILICTFLARALPPWAETGLGLVGGIFVCYLGVEAIVTAPSASLSVAERGSVPAGKDLLRGLFVNILSPNPWIFWLGVGGPILAEGWRTSGWVALAFLVGFYLLLVGSKVALAAAIAGGRGRLTDRWYRWLLLGSGLLLLAFGVMLLVNALRGAL